MGRDDMTGKIQTVLGPISPERLGVTQTHEHLLIDYSLLATPPTEASAKDLYYKPVSMETIGLIRHHGMKVMDNPHLLDINTAIEEAMLYKQYGGNSLVDATSLGIGRDPVGLARISRATGLNVIMGGSYYVDRAHPPDMDDRSEDDLVEQIVGDITEGVDDTGIKTGVIGEVGCSWPLTNNERKVLRASGRAQRITGAPILIHPGFDDQAPLEIIEVLRDAGANLGQTIIGHIDAVVSQLDILKQVAESGCYIEWDLIGKEESHFKRFTPNDNTRMDYIAWLSSQGYGDKILVAQDICDKNRLFRYGGHGYFFILANIVPRMRARGFSQDAINKILVENPKAALTFVEPKRE